MFVTYERLRAMGTNGFQEPTPARTPLARPMCCISRSNPVPTSSRAIVVQQKTGRPVQFELLEALRSSMLAWLERRVGTLDDFVFPSRIDHANHISTRQYARLVDEWMTGIGLRPEDYGTHSLRRTKASIIYKQTGNLRAVQLLLGHTKIESTVRYLGIEVDDALSIAEQVDL